MKKFFLILFFSVISISVRATENPHNALFDGDIAVYSKASSMWSNVESAEDDIVLKKTLIEGVGSHSIYNKEDGSLAFALSTNYEFVKDGKLIIVDNDLLKYYEMIYDADSFKQRELTEAEIQEIFPDYEVFRISQIDSDNKIWIHKPFGKNRKLVLVNDTDRFFHRISCRWKNVQDSEIKGLISISRYGIITFKHFGERDGKLIFYIR